MEKGRERDPRRMLLRRAPPSQGQIDKDARVGGRASSSNSDRYPGSSSSSQRGVVRPQVFPQPSVQPLFSSAAATQHCEKSCSTSRSSKSTGRINVNETSGTVEEVVDHLSSTGSSSRESG
ncbi:unnamed protein product [Amoebophrya sp. A120]|nr:unnamed protein product [Amoebophrya sp. A120]|eukprot:GSA120T00014099001.1